MATSAKKGFVIILMLSMITIFLLMIVTIVSLSCGEGIQARARNDSLAATYVAMAGAERMYARLIAWPPTQSVSWPLAPSDLNDVPIQVNGSTVGSFTVTANLTDQNEEFAIISVGSVNGRDSTVTVKYGYNSNTVTNGVPLGSIGAMNFSGSRWFIFVSRVYVDGPIRSASGINPAVSTPNSSPYVQYFGDVLPNQSGFTNSSFWYKYNALTDSWTPKAVYDTNGNSQFVTDKTDKGYVDITDTGGDAGQIAIFTADDINSDGRVDTKDAFTSFYTVELNKQYGLQIAPGEANYYTGDQNFGPSAVPAGTSVIFVDGDADISFNAQQWWGSTSDLTVVSTQDITIVQPVNGADDRLNLIAYGDIMTGGINLGQLADINGNLNMYANGDFTAVMGGNTTGSIMVGGVTDVHTGLPSFLFNRDINQGTDDWSDPVKRPMGLPPGYPQVSRLFSLKPENFSGYKPRWQRR